jgi:hypothetical protein
MSIVFDKFCQKKCHSPLAFKLFLRNIRGKKNPKILKDMKHGLDRSMEGYLNIQLCHCAKLDLITATKLLWKGIIA